jgi:hypothetical protein
MAHRKIRLKWQLAQAAITITRAASGASELVYIAFANKPLRYHGDSRIAYIGTTKNGALRVANSAVWKADVVLERKGIHTLEFWLIPAPRRGNQPTYLKLERALLLRFHERYHSVPIANKQGRNFFWRDELDYFTIGSIDRIIDYGSPDMRGGNSITGLTRIGSTTLAQFKALYAAYRKAHSKEGRRDYVEQIADCFKDYPPLTVRERAVIAAEWATLEQGEKRDKENVRIPSQQEAARVFRISRRQLQKAKAG